jgi:hypothetical protein
VRFKGGIIGHCGPFVKINLCDKNIYALLSGKGISGKFKMSKMPKVPKIVVFCLFYKKMARSGTLILVIS